MTATINSRENTAQLAYRRTGRAQSGRTKFPAIAELSRLSTTRYGDVPLALTQLVAVRCARGVVSGGGARVSETLPPPTTGARRLRERVAIGVRSENCGSRRVCDDGRASACRRSAGTRGGSRDLVLFAPSKKLTLLFFSALAFLHLHAYRQCAQHGLQRVDRTHRTHHLCSRLSEE